MAVVHALLQVLLYIAFAGGLVSLAFVDSLLSH